MAPPSTARSIPVDAIDSTFTSKYTNLISAPLGSKILAFSDEWFAAASNLITPTPPIRKPGVFTHAGAWYDGWETRRHNTDQRHGWELGSVTEKAYTHVRLLMYPDGGIARFRLYGIAVPVFPASADAVFELSATVMGGVATSCSDQHFGTKDNLLLPGRGKDMGDGWETKRTRGEHVDWTIVKLGAKGEIDHLVIDTAHFRGNFPQKVQVFAGSFEAEPGHEDAAWVEVLEPQKSGPDKEQEYKAELKEVQGKAYTHAKLVIIPDGGVKRFRVFGKKA
ncbi:Allantoicase [Massarina eburnea CBS 473.64]|uniref:Allantoicase n=1 Tax=Massarina eburnea CBS 473.64 TaxID=1395130 RepID=A0A6A6RXN5_9PLEO|nr:Allantoicase [Massarina eburnea CBS 473.64]